MNLHDYAHALDLDRRRLAEGRRLIAEAAPRSRPGGARRALGTALVTAGNRLLRVPRPATGRDPCG